MIIISDHTEQKRLDDPPNVIPLLPGYTFIDGFSNVIVQNIYQQLSVGLLLLKIHVEWGRKMSLFSQLPFY